MMYQKTQQAQVSNKHIPSVALSTQLMKRVCLGNTTIYRSQHSVSNVAVVVRSWWLLLSSGLGGYRCQVEKPTYRSLK